MPTEIEPSTIIWQDWTIRLRQPQDRSKDAKVIILLHGWTGDEYSMWIFANQFPENILLIAPRAPFKTTTSGFGWTQQHHQEFSNAADFSPVSGALMDSIQSLLSNLNQTLSPLHLIGFSQGAALSYYLAAVYPERIGRVACLAGFLPLGIKPLAKQGVFVGKEFFIAHGTQDETVPVRYAREAAQTLQEGNARVIYCEDDTGHKLSASCFRGLKAFVTSISDEN